MRILRTIEDAFFRFVEFPNGLRDGVGCWEWQASIGSHGYGQLTHLQQKYTAHRLSWEIHRGPIPDGLCVLHRCDNRSCVNPDHLFLGTKADNLQDMTDKGRRAVGSKHGSCKLTEEQVKEIRAGDALPAQVIADAYGISRSLVYLIRNKKRWSHV